MIKDIIERLYGEELKSQGFVIVPREPTERMKDTGWSRIPDYDPDLSSAADIYQAMITAYEEETR